MDIDTSYNAVMARAVPGTFVPDIGASSDPQTQAIPGGADAVPGTSFKDTVKSYLSDVSDKVNQSDQLSRDLATGATNDVSKVVASAEEANLAMEFTLAIRNKLLDAYTQISQMQF
jgi:flagellar hook-basal body complex protein FliE